MELTRTTTVTDEELWEALWSGDAHSVLLWADDLKMLRDPSTRPYQRDSTGGLMATPGSFVVLDHDTPDEGYLVTLKGLAVAYQQAVTEGQTHCWTVPLDHEDPDSCFADILIQFACFGKVIYG